MWIRSKKTIILVLIIFILSMVIVFQQLEIYSRSNNSKSAFVSQAISGTAHITRSTNAIYSFVVMPSYSNALILGNLTITDFGLPSQGNYLPLLTLLVMSADQYNKWLAGNGTFLWSTNINFTLVRQNMTTTSSSTLNNCSIGLVTYFEVPISGVGIYYLVARSGSTFSNSDYVNIRVSLDLRYMASS